MATTSNYGIVYPTTGDAVTPLANLFSNLANSVDTALVNFATARTKNGVGLAVNKPSSGMIIGDTYQETDGNKLQWRYDGANWLTNDSGLILIRPASVVNATIAADGAAIPSGGQASMSLNGVFSTRFRKYLIQYDFRLTGGATAAAIRFRRSGTDIASTDYANTRVYGEVSGSAVASRNDATTGIDIMASTSTEIEGDITIFGAGLTGGKTYHGTSAYYASPRTAIHTVAGTCTGAGLSPVDGISVALSGTTLPSDGNTYLKVYGIA